MEHGLDFFWCGFEFVRVFEERRHVRREPGCGCTWIESDDVEGFDGACDDVLDGCPFVIVRSVFFLDCLNVFQRCCQGV
jgi:hypothetical protein